MTTVSYSELRANLADYLDRADEDCEEIIVSRNKGRMTVIISLDEFLSLQETAYLLSSKKNREHLETSLQEARRGKIKKVKLS